MRRFPFTAGQVFFCMLGSFFALFLFFFRVDFLIVFWSFWGAILGAFWEPKSTQDGPSWAQDGSWNDIFWKKWIFTKSFKNQWKINKNDPKSGHKTAQDRPKTVPGRSWRGVFFASFFASIFGRFLIRFWSHFGRLLGRFGGPNRSFWASIFGWFLHVVPRAAKSCPRAAKSSPEEQHKSSQE